MKREKNIIPKDSRYVPLTQQKWCCVPTCIQMVMLRHNIPLVPAELMAHHMHIVVPKKDVGFFWTMRTTRKRPDAGYGTQLSEKRTANPMFKKLKIPLHMEWKLIDSLPTFDVFKKYLKSYATKDRDILVCFDYGTLSSTGNHQGHVCVLDKVYMSRSEVRLVDPSAEAPKWPIVKMEKLFKAMQRHGKENMGGFWEVKSTKRF